MAPACSATGWGERRTALCAVAVGVLFALGLAAGARAVEAYLPPYDVSHYRAFLTDDDPDNVRLAYLHIGRVASLHYYARYQEAAEAYAALADRFPDHALADDARFLRAHVLHVYAGELGEAQAAYQDLAQAGGVAFDYNPATQTVLQVPADPQTLTALAEQAGGQAADVDRLSARISAAEQAEPVDAAALAGLLLSRARAYRTAGAYWAAARDLTQAHGLVETLREGEDAEGQAALVADLTFELAQHWMATLLDKVHTPLDRPAIGVTTTEDHSRTSELCTTVLQALEAFFETADQDDPRRAEALYWQGRALQEVGVRWVWSVDLPTGAAVEINGDHERAAQVFAELIDTYPDSDWAPRALLARARSLASYRRWEIEGQEPIERGLRQYDEALALLERVREDYPDTPAAETADGYAQIVRELQRGERPAWELAPAPEPPPDAEPQP